MKAVPEVSGQQQQDGRATAEDRKGGVCGEWGDPRGARCSSRAGTQYPAGQKAESHSLGSGGREEMKRTHNSSKGFLEAEQEGRV